MQGTFIANLLCVYSPVSSLPQKAPRLKAERYAHAYVLVWRELNYAHAHARDCTAYTCTAAEIMILLLVYCYGMQFVRSEEWNPEWELVDPGMALSPTLQVYDIVNTYFLSCTDVSYSLAIWLWARLVVLHRAAHNHSTLSW